MVWVFSPFERNVPLFASRYFVRGNLPCPSFVLPLLPRKRSTSPTAPASPKIPTRVPGADTRRQPLPARPARPGPALRTTTPAPPPPPRQAEDAQTHRSRWQRGEEEFGGSPRGGGLGTWGGGGEGGRWAQLPPDGNCVEAAPPERAASPPRALRLRTPPAAAAAEPGSAGAAATRSEPATLKILFVKLPSPPELDGAVRNNWADS